MQSSVEGLKFELDLEKYVKPIKTVYSILRGDGETFYNAVDLTSPISFICGLVQTFWHI